MRIITPSVEIMRTGLEKEFIIPEQFIERVGRTCYKSEDKITNDSAAKFVGGLISRGHEAMIEHWNLIFKAEAPDYEEIVSDWEMLLHNGNIPMNERLRPYLRFTDITTEDQTRCIISGNMRAWRDFVKACIEGFGFAPNYLYGIIRNYPLFFPEYQDYVPTIIVNDILIPVSVKELTEAERKIHQDITVKFVCDRGVSHEIVRHRVASFAQESTRYCNYGQDKFGNEITVIRPSWCDMGSDVYDVWRDSCSLAEGSYFTLLSSGATPQEARSVLPNSLKTEVIVTMNLSNWEHFFELRCAPSAHPDMQEVAVMANELFLTEVYGGAYELGEEALPQD
jgi:thymidylate synthase (FAD)